VFRAYDATRERLVAVKLFALDLPPERTHQLVAELEHLVGAELTHPALAAPLATGISGVSAFLAQDYVAADSLDLAVREYGPAPVGSALRVATQLAGALDFAAAVQIMHGALHPRDVLLSSDDTRLTGLGITRALHRIGVVAPVRRPYTAPERIAGGEWDRRADVFSLAALMHELMWGRRVSGLGACQRCRTYLRRRSPKMPLIDSTRRWHLPKPCGTHART
jgi:serine/threonine protein kinase